MLFENLVYKKTLPFQHLPWVDGESPEDLPALPLFQWAIENDHVALLNSLICQLGSTHIHQYFDYPIRSRDTAIHLACSFGNNRIVEVLLENDVKTTTYGEFGTATQTAARAGCVEIVE